MKSFLFEIIAIILVTVAIIVIVNMDREITTHWAFWVGVAIVVIVFIGVPAGIIGLARNL